MKKECKGADLTDCTRAKAKELWEKDGCKQGRDLDYWLQAEKIIRNELEEDLDSISKIRRVK